MAGFEDAWKTAAPPQNGEFVSSDLKPLLRKVYLELQGFPVNLVSLKEDLIALLEYLSEAGRTNANCWAVDMFFCAFEGWEKDWTERNLPDDFHDLFAYMVQALHDTVTSPEIAENFDCLPEQLVQRARRLAV